MLAKYAIGNIVYYVSDIDRTEAFYRDTLGFTDAGTMPMPSPSIACPATGLNTAATS